MIAPAIPRWVAALLDDAATGVNALSPLVPRGAGEVAPPPVLVVNAMDDAEAARHRIDVAATTALWKLTVRVAEEMQLAADPQSGSVEDSCTVVLVLEGVTAEGDNAATLAAACRIMRAARRCLVLAFIAMRADPLLLEGTLITPPDQLSGISLGDPPGAGTLELGLALPFSLTDTWALGAEET